MIHDFDMARWILGEEPVSIHSQGSCLVDPQIGQLGDIDTACVTMVTLTGKQAVILNSRRAVYGYDQRIEAFGSAGMVISDNPRATGNLRYSSTSFGAPDRIFTFYMDRYGESYRREIETFLPVCGRHAAPGQCHRWPAHGLSGGGSGSVSSVRGSRRTQNRLRSDLA